MAPKATNRLSGTGLSLPWRTHGELAAGYSLEMTNHETVLSDLLAVSCAETQRLRRLLELHAISDTLATPMVQASADISHTLHAAHPPCPPDDLVPCSRLAGMGAGLGEASLDLGPSSERMRCGLPSDYTSECSKCGGSMCAGDCAANLGDFDEEIHEETACHPAPAQAGQAPSPIADLNVLIDQLTSTLDQQSGTLSRALALDEYSVLQITERFALCDPGGSGLVSFDGLAYIVQRHDPRCIFESIRNIDGLRETFDEIQTMRTGNPPADEHHVGLYDIIDWTEHFLNENRKFNLAARFPDALRWLFWRRSADTRARLQNLARAADSLARASEPMRLA